MAHSDAAVSEQWVGQPTPLPSEQNSHELRRVDKHASIWRPPETLAYLPESKNLKQFAHIT